AGEADLLSLGKAGHGKVGRAVPGSTLRAALEAGRPVLVVERQPRVGRGLLAVYDGSEGSTSALAMAADLAAGTGQGLSVLILGGGASMGQLSEQVERLLARHGQGAILAHSWARPAVAIPAAVRRIRPALLVLGLGTDHGQAVERAEQLVKAVSCPLLIVP
ncbi:MAG: hypothetical protein QME94_19005, partial [Anaerolineae bacterium]|nr:hypothetical protein [Anaerolineae bacterium]